MFYQIDLRQRPLVGHAMTDAPSLWRVLEMAEEEVVRQYCFQQLIAAAETIPALES